MIQKIFHHQLFRSSIIYIITDSINKSIPFLLLPVITKYLAPAEFGIVTNFLIFSSIILILIGVNIEGAISANFYKLAKQELTRYISSTVAIICSTFVIVLILAAIFQDIIFAYTEIPFTYQLLTIALSFFQVFTLINLALWRLEEKPLRFGVYQIMQTALNLGLSLFMIISLQRGWQGRADGHIIAITSFGFISLIILWKRGYLTFLYAKPYIRDALHFGLPLLPHSLSIWIRTGVDKIIITAILGATANGIYATGFQFGILMAFLMVAFNNAFVPFLYKNLSTENKDELKKIKHRLMNLTYLMILAIVILCIVLTVISHVLILYFLPQQYQEARQFVFWALLAQSFQGMYFLVGNYVFFVKRTKFLAVITFSCSFLQIVLTYIFVKRIGIMGAAYASVIVSFINFVAVWVYSARVYPMPWLHFLKR